MTRSDIIRDFSQGDSFLIRVFFEESDECFLDTVQFFHHDDIIRK